jgi:energy-coupling factor transporter ATP-binding protein EcfA2
MYVSEVKVKNYKSYEDSGTLRLASGFNLITGRNNAGKTALLEAISGSMSSSPHKSVRNMPQPGRVINPTSEVNVSFVLTNAEFWLTAGGGELLFAAPQVGFPLPASGGFVRSPEHLQAFTEWVFRRDTYRVSGRRTVTVGGGTAWNSRSLGLGCYQPEPAAADGLTDAIRIYVDGDGRPRNHGLQQVNQNQTIETTLSANLTARIYRFFAERFNVGQCPFGYNATLSPNAANLPEVLNILQGNTARFHHFTRLVREILPQVRHVSVRPLQPGQVEVIVWHVGHETERDDLVTPLNQCGSGVGQVLAMLYVVMTAMQSQVIIVDEPQTFLHPGALRKLIDVLKQYPQHQYIFATHSPTVIAAAQPATIALALPNETETQVVEIQASSAKDLNLYLSEVGARLSDVFGADRILWVEGQTEEHCVPALINKVARQALMGTAVVGIRETGDLEGRDARRAFALYRRLGAAHSLLPPAVAFLLDSECRTDAEKRELTALSQDKAVFLPRRTIAAVANSIQGFRERLVTPEEIETQLETKRADIRYYCRGTRAVPGDWLRFIDGGSVLADIFRELSEARVEYVKTEHSVAITEWLVANNPEQLRELADLLAGLLATE